MKRRDLLKSCLVAPFVGLLKKMKRIEPKYEASGCPSCPSSSSNSSDVPDLPMKDWVHAQFNPVIDLQFNEPFEGKVVGMCEFQGNLWIASEKGVYRIKNYET